ncbi:ferric reductase like transmembrane component-domain-containing protein [Dactylonectria macrodidyma]|uniref:Ferric reductase like transmembrane component-domain-containing protein n=1 Tax=Dactylonectria macrodidyma TaxID=307937 RepID=A0A9P9E1K7_9HYPO|nr:ferric reductase like transmembrane component-domain-containing protein [Dactylonectria macrodidyma]
MLLLVFCAAAVLCIVPSTSGELLVGYGLSRYSPACAYACKNSVPTMVDCAEFQGLTAEELAAASPSAQCLANDTSYLATIAWCVHDRCNSVSLWDIDRFWGTNLIDGQNNNGVVLRYTYQEAVQQVDPDVLQALTADDMSLNKAMMVPDDMYIAHLNGVLSEIKVITGNSKYALIVFLSGVIIPIGFSLLRLFPIPTKMRSKFYAYIIDPPAFGKHHSVPVLGLGFVPTRGQAIFILYLIAINVAACFADFPYLTPNADSRGRTNDLNRYIGCRVGAVCLANIPLVILYAGRNSMLQWMTNWSHSTFLLLHRWTGTICTLEAAVHSIMWLRRWIQRGIFAEQSKLPYWYWGVIATLSMSLIIPFSILPVRKAGYEAFLVGHIFLAIMAVVGAWHHIFYYFQFTPTVGYNTWLYMAMAIWGFDRLLRLVRMTKHGVKRAHVTAVDEEHIRVDIPGVFCHGYCYVYFPTLSWRMWENHPFSVVSCNHGHVRPPISGPRSSRSNFQSDTDGSRPGLEPSSPSSKELQIEERPIPAACVSKQQCGVTFIIRVHDSLTRLLATKIGVLEGVPVLIEGSYGHESRTHLQSGQKDFAPTPEYPNTICIAGGVGIVAVLPALDNAVSLYSPIGTTKLHWGVRHQGLVDTIESMLAERDDTESKWGHIETNISVGSRLNVRKILEDQLSRAGGAGTTVVTCGPQAMCDEVRCTAAGLARHGATVRYMEELCTW